MPGIVLPRRVRIPVRYTSTADSVIAADVVCVMVGGEYGFELQTLGRKVFEHRAGFTGIDDHGAAIASQAPDIVVLERPDGLDGDGIHAGIFIFEPLNVKYSPDPQACRNGSPPRWERISSKPSCSISTAN